MLDAPIVFAMVSGFNQSVFEISWHVWLSSWNLLVGQWCSCSVDIVVSEFPLFQVQKHSQKQLLRG